MDEGRVQLVAQVKDRQFHRQGTHTSQRILLGRRARMHCWISGHHKDTPGLYQTEWDSGKARSVSSGCDCRFCRQPATATGFRRYDFQARRRHCRELPYRTEPNPASAAFIGRQGGRYWETSELKDLPRDISYSEAGISVRTTNELWNMPMVILLLLGLPIAEWLLRRKWGVV